MNRILFASILFLFSGLFIVEAATATSKELFACELTPGLKQCISEMETSEQARRLASYPMQMSRDGSCRIFLDNSEDCLCQKTADDTFIFRRENCVKPLPSQSVSKEVGTCYTGTHCNCSPSKKPMTREECGIALDEEGLFGVGSWRGLKSKKCEKIGSNKERPDNCNTK